MGNWLVLNKMAREGKLPPSVISHAAIFSAMSPNTSVPMQELYFGHYMDFKAKHPEFDLTKEIDPELAQHFHNYMNTSTPPEFMRQYYLDRKERLCLDSTSYTHSSRLFTRAWALTVAECRSTSWMPSSLARRIQVRFNRMVWAQS
jgi:hypothetical protein